MRPPVLPQKSSAWPGALALGIAAVVFVLFARASKKQQEETEAVERPLAATLASTPKPTGTWKLLKTSLNDEIETTLPNVGHVSLLRKRYGVGTRLWIRLPEYAEPALIQATVQFGKLSPVRVPINGTDVNGIACVYIPQNYPPECRSCIVTLRQGDVDLSSHSIADLPKTVRIWPTTPVASAPVKCGPAKVSARAWLQVPSSESDQISVEYSVSLPAKPGENWEFNRQVKEIPTYVAAKYANHILDGDKSIAYPILDGKFQMSSGVGLDLPAIQETYRARGALRRFETADEVVEFRNVRIRTDYRSPDGKTTASISDPQSPMVAALPSGVTVTLLPNPKGETELATIANQKILIINYLLSPTENSPLDLPKSPVLRGRKGAVRLNLNNPQGKVVFRSGTFSDSTPDAVKQNDKHERMTIAIDATAYTGNVIPSLRLKVRHRFDAEVYPFSFSVPILPKRPADALNLKMPSPSR